MSDERTAHRTSGVLPGIQMLRGLSAALVVITHANLMMRYPQYFQKSPFALHDAGLFGVAIFFVISGFIIAISSLRSDMGPRFTRPEFAHRRFVRIVPFLWIAVIGYNLLSLAGTGAVEWGSLIRALLVWPVGELKPNVVWSLRHEALFYALFAVVILGARKHVWVLVAWFLAPLYCWPILWITHSTIPTSPDPWSELFRVVFLGAHSGANLQFGAGFLLGWLTLKGSPLLAPRFKSLLLPALAAVAATAIIEILALPISLERSVVWTLLATPPVWLAIRCTADSGWLYRIGNMLGDSSFALYLVHNGALLLMFEVARRARILPPELFFIVFVVGALVVGQLAHWFVEKPLINLLSRGRAVTPWQKTARPAESTSQL
jgi:peptidoglycan/LPS O-acetylase OafA/YrhL